MNKLQLYIYKSLRGFKCLQNINPSDNIQRHIRDERKALELLSYDPSEKNIFYLLTYINDGILLTVLRTIPPKEFDHLACTIFIPNGMDISRQELTDIVIRTGRMLSNSSMSTEQIIELHELFSKEYKVNANAPAIVPNHGRDYAYMLYGGDTGRQLGDVFGDMIYQTDFLKYAGVLMIDADLGVEVNAVNLTDEPLYKPAVLLPPQPVNGFMPYVYGRLLDSPMRVSLGTEVEVVWRRKGFDDIRQTVMVRSEEQVVEAESLDGSRKVISSNSFYVSANGGKVKVEDAEITVNGTLITGEHSFSFDELKNARVTVRATGYRPYQSTLDLASTTQALISLTELKRIYGFEMPVKSSELGSPIRFEIHTKRQLSDSPLEGYSLVEEMREGAGRFNHLQYTGQSGIAVKQVLIYVACALVAGFIIGALIFHSGKSKEETTVDVKFENADVKGTVNPESEKPSDTKPEAIVNEQPAVQPAVAPENTEKPKQPEEKSTEEVAKESIAYLEANSTWKRSELDRLPGLKGLYDDMNNFRFDRLTDYWKPRLEKSKRFEKVVYHVGESQKKKNFKASGTYNKEGDTSISVQTYLNTIDPAKK